MVVGGSHLKGMWTSLEKMRGKKRIKINSFFDLCNKINIHIMSSISIPYNLDRKQMICHLQTCNLMEIHNTYYQYYTKEHC